MFRNGFPGFFSGMEEDGSQSQSQPQDIDNKTFYELLGLKPGATTDEVKKAFRRKAVREHPDKGGDPDNFRKLTEAYEVLSNPEKKDIYDRYGLEGLKNGAGSSSDLGDIFGSLFGFGGGGQKDRGPKKMKAKMRELVTTLEDVYEGKMVNMKHSRKRVCEVCDGKGGANSKVCPTCKGKRMVQKLVMLGPGMYSQQTAPCSDCQGEGVKFDEKDRCKNCKGQRVLEVEKTIEVPLEKGVPDEHDYVFYGESDEVPGVMAGDLYVRIKIQKHKLYERKGADLCINKTVTLFEALTGTQFQLKFLDGSLLNITTRPGEIISPGQIKTVKNKGMPFYKDAMSHGNLHIKFEIEFPKPNTLSQQQLEQLKQVLPAPKQKVNFDQKKALVLEDFVEGDANPNPEGGRMKDGEDDEDQQRGGQRVQCAQQ